MPRSALLLGATGLVGGHCIQLLLQDPAYARVVAFMRRPWSQSHPKLEPYLVDFAQLERHAAHMRVHDVFCCLGTTIKKAGTKAAFRKVDLEYPHRLAELASQNGVQQFLLVTALGANPASHVFYNRVKGEVEAAIARVPLRSLHIFRPSLLLGEREEARRGERIGEYAYKATAFLWRGPLRKYRPIAAHTVALAMLHFAKQEHAGIHIHESLQIQNVVEQLSRKGAARLE